MKKLLLTTCLSLIFFSGTTLFAQDGKYRIKGSIDPSFDGQYAILSVKDDCSKIIRSDTSMISHGEFYFEGKEYLKGLSNIVIEDNYEIRTRKMLGLILEKGTLTVSYPDEWPYMEGTPLNDIFMKYRDSMKYYIKEIAKIEPDWTNNISIFPDTDLGRLYYSFGKYFMKYVKQNYSNPLGKAMLYSGLELGNLAMNIYVSFNNHYFNKPFDETFDFTDEETKAHPRFVAFAEIFKNVKPDPNIGKNIEATTYFATPDGKMEKLSDFTGKKEYTFVEFWASWCGPCLASITELKEIYGKYSDDLEIISVSLDTKKEAWFDALKEQDMPWLQLSAPEGFKSEIAKELCIEGIPFGLLLDKDGTIIHQMGTSELNWFMETH